MDLVVELRLPLKTRRVCADVHVRGHPVQLKSQSMRPGSWSAVARQGISPPSRFTCTYLVHIAWMRCCCNLLTDISIISEPIIKTHETLLREVKAPSDCL